MIYELKEHNATIDLSKITVIEWKKSAQANKIPLWRSLLRLYKKPHLMISADQSCAYDYYEYDTDKETEEAYKAIIKAWKEK